MNFLLPVILSISLQFSEPLSQPSFSQPCLSMDTKNVKSEQHHLFDKAEKEHGILPQLLKAVAHVESGRFDPDSKRQAAWPWTITVKGKGQYFNSKEEAIKEIKRLNRAGIHDFDVGLMQINNYWHKGAFSSAEDALDPETNIAYGAKFLKELFNKHKSWTKAIACYHSYNPKYNQAYCKRVLHAWGKVKASQYEHLLAHSKTNIKPKSPKRYLSLPRKANGRKVIRIFRRMA